MKTTKAYPRLGIISGAGPMAGALLFGKIIQIAQEKYGCQKDEDFPYTMMISYPFADMLQNVGQAESQLVSEQLTESLLELAKNNIQVAAIACNTLHAFLDAASIEGLTLLHLIQETRYAIEQAGIEEIIVICTTTAAQCKLHQAHFCCRYPNEIQQSNIQKLIDCIMAGKQVAEDAKQLAFLLNKELEESSQERVGLVLGCTEFSVLNAAFPLHLYGLDKRYVILDPSIIIAEKMCQLAFKDSKKKKDRLL